jgi:hypothetical protein
MSHRPPNKSRNIVIVLGALALAAIAAWVASGQPDGLEATADSLGFAEQARSAGLAVMPDYRWPGLDSRYGEAIAGLIGTGLIFLAMLSLGWLSRWRELRRQAVRPDEDRPSAKPLGTGTGG